MKLRTSAKVSVCSDEVKDENLFSTIQNSWIANKSGKSAQRKGDG